MLKLKSPCAVLKTQCSQINKEIKETCYKSKYVLKGELFNRFLKIKYLFIYLAALDLSCNTWDLLCILRDVSSQHTDSLAVTLWHTGSRERGLSSCGMRA